MCALFVLLSAAAESYTEITEKSRGRGAPSHQHVLIRIDFDKSASHQQSGTKARMEYCGRARLSVPS
jgi:hypothetical protein